MAAMGFDGRVGVTNANAREGKRLARKNSLFSKRLHEATEETKKHSLIITNPPKCEPVLSDPLPPLPSYDDVCGMVQCAIPLAPLQPPKKRRLYRDILGGVWSC